MFKSYILFVLIVLTLTHVDGMKKKLRKKESKEYALPLRQEADGTYGFLKYENEYETTGNKFFCPAEEEDFRQFDMHCLVLSQKNEKYCSNPVTPLLIKSEQMNISCGTDGNSIYYDFIYRTKIPPIKTQDLPVYRMCYNSEKKEIVYSYYHIRQPNLLIKAILKDQTDIKYKFITTDFPIETNNFNGLEKAYKQHISLSFFTNTSTLPPLKPLMLISPEDMAFAPLKKLAYHHMNTRPAWNNIIEAWDILNNDIQSKAIYWKSSVYEVSGSMGELILNEEKVYLDKARQITVPKYFWKHIYYPEKDLFRTLILHNVPDEKYEMDKLCTDNAIEKIKESNGNLEKIAYYCKSDVITRLYHLPKILRLLDCKENFLPLILTFHEGKYEFPKEYNSVNALNDNSITPFCYDEMNKLDDGIKEENVDYENCLVPYEATKQYCRDPLETTSMYKNDSELIKNSCKSEKDYYTKETYKICIKDPNTKKIMVDYLVLYEGCYPSAYIQRFNFTHHRIISPALLINKDLKNQRTINYQTEKYNATHKNGCQINFSSDRYATKDDCIADQSGLPSHKITQIQLVSANDMAFAMWKKPTYFFKNLLLAWRATEKMWTMINKRIRLQAITENEEYSEINGSSGILKIRDEEITSYGYPLELPLYYWKIVYSADRKRSIAIILHNVPNFEFISPKDRVCFQSVCNISSWDLDSLFPIDRYAYCCDSKVITNKHNFVETEDLLKIEDVYKPLVITFHKGEYFFPEKYGGLEQPTDDAEKKQMFFCPDGEYTSEKNYYNLIPNKNEYPYCTQPVKPSLLKFKQTFKTDGTTYSYYRFIFRLKLDNESENQKIKDIIIYEFCYDPINKNIIYASNQIKSPILLENKNLKNERNVTYPVETNDYDLLNENFENILKSYKLKKQFKLNHFDSNCHLKPLMLVSPNNFSFALWKKATYHAINLKPAWTHVFHLWNGINRYIEKLAIAERQEFIQINGSEGEMKLNDKTVYLNELDKIAVPKYFWKIVYNADQTENIAIILHNNTFAEERLCETDLCDIEKRYERSGYTLSARLAYCCSAELFTTKYNLHVATATMKMKDFIIEIPENA